MFIIIISSVKELSRFFQTVQCTLVLIDWQNACKIIMPYCIIKKRKLFAGAGVRDYNFHLNNWFLKLAKLTFSYNNQGNMLSQRYRYSSATK